MNERDDGKVQFHLKLGQLTTGAQQAFMRQLVSAAEGVGKSGRGSRHEVLAALEKARRTNTT